MAVRRKALAVGAGAAVSAAVAAAATGLQVATSDVSVASITGSSTFDVNSVGCDADVALTNGDLQSLDGTLYYSWDYAVTTPPGSNDCRTLLLLVTGDESGITNTGPVLPTTPQVGVLDPVARSGRVSVTVAPDRERVGPTLVNVIGIS